MDVIKKEKTEAKKICLLP